MIEEAENPKHTAGYRSEIAGWGNELNRLFVIQSSATILYLQLRENPFLIGQLQDVLREYKRFLYSFLSTPDKASLDEKFGLFEKESVKCIRNLEQLKVMGHPLDIPSSYKRILDDLYDQLVFYKQKYNLGMPSSRRDVRSQSEKMDYDMLHL